MTPVVFGGLVKKRRKKKKRNLGGKGEKTTQMPAGWSKTF